MAEEVQIPCLFTKQKNKKRKTFADGILKISAGSYCRLYGADSSKISSACLESYSMSKDDVVALMKRTDDFEIEFENYLIIVDKPIVKDPQNTEIKKSLTKAFKVPRYLPPAPKSSELMTTARPCLQRPGILQTDHSKNHGSKYVLNDDELDDIWDKPQHKERQEPAHEKENVAVVHRRAGPLTTTRPPAATS